MFRKIVAGLATALGLVIALPAFAGDKPAAPAAEKKDAAHKWANEKTAMTHLKEHIKYPATKTEILAQCTGMSEADKADKEWLTANLPEGSYKTADEVMKALKM
jgi:hypothetical protein